MENKSYPEAVDNPATPINVAESLIAEIQDYALKKPNQEEKSCDEISHSSLCDDDFITEKRENIIKANTPDTIFNIPDGYTYQKIEDMVNGLQRLSAENPIPEPPNLISIGDAVILREGGLVFVTGKAGCRKTTAMTLLCADAMRPGFVKNSPFTIPKALKVLYIDPEQLPADTQVINNRIKRLIGSDENIDVFSLVELDMQLLPIVIEMLMSRKHYDLVVIDNVMKLGKDMTMDISIAEDRIRNLRRLAIKHKCGIINAVHMNQGEKDGKLRGHAGAEAVREGDLVLGFIADDTDVFSYTKSLKNRLKAPEEFCVSIDETGLPFYYQRENSQIERMKANVEVKGKKMNNPDTFLPIINQIPNEGISHGKLKEIISPMHASTATANRWIKQMEQLNLIHKRNNRYYVGALQQVKDNQESFDW